jgi:hypothetical protein
MRGVDLDALDRAQHGNGGRDAAIAIEQGRPDETDHNHDRAPPALLGVVISIKYTILIMRADNHGEGGILALPIKDQKISDTTPSTACGDI